MSWLDNLFGRKPEYPVFGPRRNFVLPEITREASKLYKIISNSFIKTHNQYKWAVFGGNKTSKNPNRLMIVEKRSNPRSLNAISIELLLFSEQHKLQILAKILSGSKVIAEKDFSVRDRLSEQEVSRLAKEILNFLNYNLVNSSFKN